jgi:hypothetical protein
MVENPKPMIWWKPQKILDKVSKSHNDNKEIMGFLGMMVYTLILHIVTNHIKGEFT